MRSAALHSASITVDLDDEATAEAVRAALLPEAAQGPDGSTTTVTRDGATLRAEVEADDISALRAAINSVVRLMDAGHRAATADSPRP